MTLALPDLPYPIPPYPPKPPMTIDQIKSAAEVLSLRKLGAEDLPECVVVQGGVEVPSRYETREGGIYLRAIKLNGIWTDPIDFGMTAAATRVMEWDCADTERIAGDES